MKKNIFFKSTLILLIGGFFTRAIGFIIRIYYTRIIGEEGINLLAIVMPTYSMLVTLATFTLPLTLSKLIAEGKKRSINIMQNAAIIISIINVVTIVIMILSCEFIANTLLNEPSSKYILIAMSLTLPFISLSSIIKGYFLGKQQTMPYMVSNVLEQILRLIIIILFLPRLVSLGALYAVIGLMLLTIISETFSVLIFMFFLPKKVIIKKNDLKYSKETKNEILSLSIPTVSSRVVGNIGYFFEPIILTNILILVGFSSSFIISEYAAYNAYALPILTIPSFFIQALSQTIIPEISKYDGVNNKKMVKKRIKQALLFTLIIGSVFSLFIFIFHSYILDILYNTQKGAEYIKILAPVFCLFYLEGIMYSILQALNKAKEAFKISLKGVIVKLFFLSLFSFLSFGLYALVIAQIINIIYIITHSFKELKQYL